MTFATIWQIISIAFIFIFEFEYDRFLFAPHFIIIFVLIVE